MDLLMFPEHIIDNIVLFCEPQALVSLAQTNRFFRNKINRRLYRNIVIENHTAIARSSNQTTISVQALHRFVKVLNSYNFQFVESISINVAVDDFFSLYEKLLKLWDLCPDRCIRFNASHLYSFPRFICQDAVHYAELEDSELVLTERHKKMNNLRNWTIGDVNELRYMPFNPNLEELALGSKSGNEQLALNERALGNLHQINTLVLSLGADINALANLNLASPLANMKSLSLSNTHSLKKHSLLTYGKLASFVNFNQLEHLDLKVSCSNHCPCIAHLLARIAASSPKLKTLSVSSNVKDIDQFQVISTSLSNLESLESVSLCLDEFGLTKDPRFSFKALATGLRSLDSLEQVHIHDIHHYIVHKGPLIIGSIPVSTV